MNQMLVSIITVTYNNDKEIEHFLSSLKIAVNNFSTQFILIDNNSYDKTLNILEKNLSYFKDIKLVKNRQNLGFTKAVNQGLKIAQGKYLLLLNPDTELSADIFHKLLPVFEKNPAIGIIAPQFINTDGSIQSSCRRFPRHRDILFHVLGFNFLFPQSKLFNYWKMGDFDHQSQRFVDQPQGAFLLIHRGAFENVGLLDEDFPMFFSDVDWCHRLIDKGWKILFTPEVKIIHHKGSSIYKNRIPLIWSSHVSFYHYFKKYYRTGLWPIINYITGIILLKLALIRILFLLISKFFKLTNST